MKRQVTQNVTQLKKFWSRGGTTMRHMECLLYPETGILMPITTLHRQPPEEKSPCKKVELRIKEREHPQVELTDLEGNPLHPAGVELVGWQIVQETLNVLNDFVQSYYNSTPPHCEQARTRSEIECLLEDQPPGTYILSEADRSIAEVARQLSETNDTLVIAYLLSILVDTNQVEQHVLITSKWGWSLLQDIPDLKSKIYKHYRDYLTLLNSLPPADKRLFSASERETSER